VIERDRVIARERVDDCGLQPSLHASIISIAVESLTLSPASLFEMVVR
jgi:hypothetical protein